MKQPTLRERWNYWFDSVMAKGSGSLIGLLALASGAFILIVTAIVVAFQLFPTRLPDGFTSLDPLEIMWGSVVRILSAGSFREDEGWGFRIAMLAVTIAGLILVASLIGIISSAFDRRLAELRKGRSRVLETGHTVILGWSSKVVPIVSELLTAQKDEGRSAIVVLCPRDKVEVEDELRTRIEAQRGTRIIVRAGEPMDSGDLEMVSLRAARSIIVVSPDTSVEPDIEVIKTVLALRRSIGDAVHVSVIGELRSDANIEAARLAGGSAVQWLVGDELIGRLTLHNVRQEGISVVSRELLDFQGDEFHVASRPDLDGVAYGEAQRRFPSATLVGFARAGLVRLNPPSADRLVPGDELVLIAANDQSMQTAPAADFDAEAIHREDERPARASRTLILGHHRGMNSLVASLHAFFATGSTAHLVSAEPLERALQPSELTFSQADTTSRATLDALDVPSYDHVVVVPYKDSVSTQSADARTLVTLLHLRDIRRRAGAKFAVVTEMLDDRNAELADEGSADDVIVSDLLISRMLAQVSRTPRLVEVFEQLFGHHGSETYLRAVEHYVTIGTPVRVATLIEAAARRNETFIGYRLASRRSERPDFGIVINPPTAATLELGTDDKIIVLADR